MIGFLIGIILGLILERLIRVVEKIISIRKSQKTLEQEFYDRF